MYSSSVDRWRGYEKHLGPLIAALGDLASGAGSGKGMDAPRRRA